MSLDDLQRLQSGATPPPATTAEPPAADEPPATGADTPPADTAQPPVSNNQPVTLTPEQLKFVTEQGWKDFIPEEYKGRAEFERVSSLPDVFKNYIHSQQTVSKSVRLPDATSTPEEVAEFYTKLGKPASMDEYEFEYTPEKEDYVFKKDSFDFSVFKEIADKANLTKTQYETLAKTYIDINNENYVNYQKELTVSADQELKQAEATLRDKWGEKYAENINSISAKVAKLYPAETVERMSQSGLFRDVNFLESHLKLTKMMTGDTLFIDGAVVENLPATLETLTSKRDALMKEDYEKNKQTVHDLNQRIVQLKQAQQSQTSKFRG